MSICWLDYETRSCSDLEEVGLDNYARHPSTEVLLAAYAFDDRAVKIWEPHRGAMPNDLREALEGCFATVYAWNAPFEKSITTHVLGIAKPIQEFRDVMVMSRHLALPGSLKESGRVLGLGKDAAKILDGERLIHLFCEPEDPGGEQTLLGISKPSFRDWTTDPKDWELFAAYCRRDVEAERVIYKKLSKFPVPEFEWETWFLDHKINQAGWPTDPDLITGARHIVELALEPMLKEIREMTGVANPNSRAQLLPWLASQGYIFSSLKKDFVARALAGEGDLTPAGRRVLEIRGQTAKSSVSKYTAVADLTSPDGRLRNEYQFMGAARTHRWSAVGCNVANLPRPSKQVEKELPFAISLVQKMDYNGIVDRFGKPLEVVSGVLRSTFKAPKGKKFVVADLGSIENRCLGWLSRCAGILKVFSTTFEYEGKQYQMDPYIDFATRMYGQSYEEIWKECESGDKSKRTMAKPGSLGAGYSMGPGEERQDEDGNTVLTGLRGYAKTMGINMSQQDAEHAIRVFRESYPEVPRFWRDMQNAAVWALRHPGRVSGVGVPHDKREEEYFERTNRTITEPILSFQCTGETALEMNLPSGRSIYYYKPRLTEEEASYTDPKTHEVRKYIRQVLWYDGRERDGKGWGPTSTHGGKLCENSCQTVARDILVNGMKLADKMGFEIVGHCYDEIVALADVDSPLDLEKLVGCMTTNPSWCLDLPLSADGFEDDHYRK